MSNRLIREMHEKLLSRRGSEKQPGEFRRSQNWIGGTKGMAALAEFGLVRELTGNRRNRVLAYDRYVAVLSEGTEPL